MSTTARKRQFEEELRILHVAIDSLRGELLHLKNASSKAGVMVGQGRHIVDALVSVDGPGIRQDLTAAFSAFEEQRRRTRAAVIALGQAEGASISKVGQQLGISRQLAARLAAEKALTRGSPRLRH